MTDRIDSTPGWDLHCHSAYSDGTESPEGLVLEAKRRGLLGVGIADHDTWVGWDEAVTAALDNHVPLIRGTEITADMNGTCVHMLGLLYDPTDKVLCDLFDTTRKNRVRRMKKMVENLSADFPITWDDVVAQAKEGERTTIGRPHIADALVALGFFDNRSEAFAKTINKNGPYYVPIVSPTAKSVVEAVKHAGGVSVIAHPGGVNRNKHVLSDAEIAELADAGLDGLEVHHRDNPPEQQRRLAGLAKDLHLLVTGGSDWHGTGKPNIMGENTTDDATVQEIIRRGAIPVIAA